MKIRKNTIRYFLVLILLVSAITTTSCQLDSSSDQNTDTNNREDSKMRTQINLGTEERAEVYLAAGCFWGTEAYFKKVSGVLETEVGYANGKTEDTSYQALEITGHVETLKIVYDKNKIHLAEILERFYRIIDPYAVNRQGNDIGTQYRSGMYYVDETSRKLMEYSLANFEQINGRKTAIEVVPLNHFIPAEDYHQDYLDKNPQGYCHINVSEAFDTLFPGKELPPDEELKENLSELSYKVMREAATERPFTSPLDKNFEEGIFVDIATGQPLFSSQDKFDAGCGWPSFTRPITTDVMLYESDASHGMQRTEVKTGGDSHLGHVFEDGPKDTGALRYCINGAALRFIPLQEMDGEYAALKPFVVNYDVVNPRD